MSLPERLPSLNARPLDRRAVLRSAAGVGTAATAAAALAACGGAPSDGGGAASSAPAADVVDASVPAADVPVGTGVVLPTHDVVVTQPTEGEFHAFSAICTHEGCAVSRVDTRGIICPCHGSLFGLSDGAALAGPAKAPLRSFVATLEGDTVHVTSP